MSNEIDWKSVAVRLFRTDGACYMLSTPERDALEAADAAYRPNTATERAAANAYQLLSEMAEEAKELKLTLGPIE